jgi:hypothetical protein
MFPPPALWDRHSREGGNPAIANYEFIRRFRRLTQIFPLRGFRPPKAGTMDLICEICGEQNPGFPPSRDDEMEGAGLGETEGLTAP